MTPLAARRVAFGSFMFVYTSTHEKAPAVYEGTSPGDVSALRSACLGG
jgi:hypothetical protein